MKRGFAKIRAGIEEHFVEGRVGAFEAGVYLVIHLQADFRTGIWIGSAPRILATMPRGASLRKVQHALERLTKIGFIRPFHTHGKRGNYRALIDKYEPQSGALRGQRLNAWKSESWKTPVYEPCADVVTDNDADSVADAAPYQDVRSKKKEKPHAAKTAAPPADSKFQPIVEAYFEGMKKTGIEPTRDKSDFGALKTWLKANPNRPLDGILASLRHAFESTDPHPLRPGFRLREFLQHEAKYQRGPLLKAGPKPVQAFRPPTAPSNELSADGERQLEAYGVAR